jgi:hypothetical protein
LIDNYSKQPSDVSPQDAYVERFQLSYRSVLGTKGNFPSCLLSETNLGFATHH